MTTKRPSGARTGARPPKSKGGPRSSKPAPKSAVAPKARSGPRTPRSAAPSGKPSPRGARGNKKGPAPARPRPPGPREPSERLHKALARAGVSSRRKAEAMIAEGRVRLNDQPVTELGVLVDPLRDLVTVDGRSVTLVSDDEQEKVYFLLHKPPKTLTTTHDDRGRKTVLDLVIGASESRIYPVGRLDFDAEGALLLTNDGALAHRLTHPRFGVPKTYLCKVKGRPSDEALEKLRKGIYLEDGPTRPAEVEVIESAKANTWVEITVTEGRNRLVKRMFWRIKHPVMRLIRVRFGNLTLEGLPPGRFRLLEKRELNDLETWLR